MLALDSYLWFVVIVWATYLPVSSSPVLQLEFFEGDIIRLKATGTSKQKARLVVVEPNGVNRRQAELVTVHYNAISGDEFRWPNATIPYAYDIAEFGAKFVDEFGAAIIDIHQKTCIRFRPKKDSDRHHVIVKNLDGCWSFVGRQKDLTEGQEMSLAQVCWTRGTLVHEIMHLLGFYHEHSRFDRDDYIRIIYDNIQQTRRGQFVKRSPESTDLLTEYDYNSTLHYAWNAWAIDPDRPTIIPKKHKAEIGQRVGLSQLDYEKINKLYKCDDHSTPQISTTTPTAAPVAQLAPQCPTDSQADCQDDRRGKVCGLCGDVNFNYTDDFLGELRTHQEFADAYMKRDSNNNPVPDGCDPNISYNPDDYIGVDCDDCEYYLEDYEYYSDYCEDYYDGAYGTFYCEYYAYYEFADRLKYCEDTCGIESPFFAPNTQAQETMKENVEREVSELLADRGSALRNRFQCVDDAHRHEVIRRCAIIANKTGAFGHCYESYRDRAYMAISCLEDGCYDMAFLDTNLMVYAKMCGRYGPPGDYRSQLGLPAATCSEGMEYSMCVYTNCLRTCLNLSPTGCDDGMTYNCEQGCICSGDTIWDEVSGGCVSEEECGTTQPGIPASCGTGRYCGTDLRYHYDHCSDSDSALICRKNSYCMPVGTILVTEACAEDKKYCECVANKKQTKAKWKCGAFKKKPELADECVECAAAIGSDDCARPFKFTSGMAGCVKPLRADRPPLPKHYLTAKPVVKKANDVCK